MHPEVRRYYDEAFDGVNNQGMSGAATRFFHMAVEKALTEDMFFGRVVELGAAHGEHVKYVRHGFDEYVLTDLEPHNVDLYALSQSIPGGNGLRHLSFRIADAMALPFSDNSVDRTVHTCLLHHLPDPESALREMRRVLRDGGVASIYLPCDPGLLYTATQSLTTGRKIRKVLREGKYGISPGYLRAQEHPNHYSALYAIAQEVFAADVVLYRGFPFPWVTPNLNYFSVLQVCVVK